MNQATRIACLLAVAVMTSNIGYAQVAHPNDVSSFIHDLIGEWIGNYEQSTNGKKVDTKYFHAVIKQSGSDTYQTVFEYYRLDARTGTPIKVGESNMTTKIATDGTATNHIVGSGEVMIDPNTYKQEQHDLSEVLRVSPSGGLAGNGRGRISVAGMPLGMGKNGAVNSSGSGWTMQNGAFKISQQLKVKFKALLFSRSFDITAEFTGNRGSDIVGLMKRAEGKGPR